MVAQPLDLKALAKFVADEIYRKDSLGGCKIFCV